MVGEDAARDSSPFERPRCRCVDDLEPAHENLVDAARERRAEALRHRSDEVRVAGDDRPVAREREHAIELLAPAVDVEVHHGHVVDFGHVSDASQLRLTHDMRPTITRRLAREDRVRLPRHSGPQKPVV